MERIEFGTVKRDLVAEHEALRKKYEQDTAAFLASGKQIYHAEPGESAYQVHMTQEQISEMRYRIRAAREKATKPKAKPQKIQLTKRNDLTGMKLNSLTVLKRADIVSVTGVYWVCMCECGKTLNVRATRLANGITKCCQSCSRKQAREQKQADYAGRVADGKVKRA